MVTTLSLSRIRILTHSLTLASSDRLQCRLTFEGGTGMCCPQEPLLQVLLLALETHSLKSFSSFIDPTSILWTQKLHFQDSSCQFWLNFSSWDSKNSFWRPSFKSKKSVQETLILNNLDGTYLLKFFSATSPRILGAQISRVEMFFLKRENLY